MLLAFFLISIIAEDICLRGKMTKEVGIISNSSENLCINQAYFVDVGNQEYWGG